mgnify:FL=1
MSILSKYYEGKGSALMQANDAYGVRRILGAKANLYTNVAKERWDELQRRGNIKGALAELPQMGNTWIPDTCLVVNTFGRFSSIDAILASEAKPPEKEEK